MPNEELKKIPVKVNLEQLDISVFSKDKIREMFRTGKVPTAELMVEEIIVRALKTGATDIHIEPSEKELQIRLGFEGALKKLVTLPREIADNLVSVLKTKASMNAFEKKKPQDGRFSFTGGSSQFDIRINTIPGLNGERIALRITQKDKFILGVNDLGLSPENLVRFRQLLRFPSGLILIGGPPSSGKSSTAYAVLNEIRSVEKSTITVEDPVELNLDFATQVQTTGDKTFTLAEALRAILRQNPNVIFVGEIRDVDTGTIAAEAAFTGTLVISTILSGDAIGTIARLQQMGISSFWLGSSLAGVIYQKLLRKICVHCREEYTPDAGEMALITDHVPGRTTFFRGKGCPECESTGYSGRIAAHEILIADESMRDIIFQQVPVSVMRDAAKASGFERITIDAAKKVADGITTIAEFHRMIG